MTEGGVRLDHLMPVERTLLLTLLGRADDAQSPAPLLGDALAEEVASKICESDLAPMAGTDLSRNGAIRTALLDQHVRNFLADSRRDSR